jgi:hypothetical protein
VSSYAFQSCFRGCVGFARLGALCLGGLLACAILVFATGLGYRYLNAIAIEEKYSNIPFAASAFSGAIVDVLAIVGIFNREREEEKFGSVQFVVWVHLGPLL